MCTSASAWQRTPGGCPGLLLGAFFLKATGREGCPAFLRTFEYIYVGLGSVEIHREFMTAAARWMMAAKLWSVLSARMAMRLNSLSLQKKFSIRWRHL